MNAGLTRRRFIQGRRAADERAIRPPWSVNGAEFLERCTRCGDCTRACGESIIIVDRSDLPQIDFHLGACTFCGECVKACATGALRRPDTDKTDPPWSLEVRFDDDCLEHQGITCRVCGDGCEQEAISFHPGSERRFAPRLEMGLCNGCGYCRSVCPIDAVTIQAARPSVVS